VNPQRAALEAERKEQAAIIEAAKKELADLKNQSPETDTRSTVTLQKELRDIKLATAELTKDTELLDNKKLDKEIQLEQAKALTPQGCGQVASGGPDQAKIARMNAEKAKNAEDIKLAMAEVKDIHKEMSSQKNGSFNLREWQKSSDAYKDLDKTLKSLAGRTSPLSLEELDKIQTTMGDAMPSLKSYGSSSRIAKLKESLAALNPALRNQLNELLGMDEILTNAGRPPSLLSR
jgi:hypothetical protein